MPSIVLGLGSIRNRDAGVGIHALRHLETHLGPGAGVETVDGGRAGSGLLRLVAACEHVLILDAADGGHEPGTLIELQAEAIVLRAGERLMPHQVVFQELLSTLRLEDQLPPHMQLIGVQPANMSPGLDLSAVVAAAIPTVLGRARVILTGWGLLTPCDWT